MMNLPEILARHAGVLFAGVTVILGVGTLVVGRCRAPIQRQRLGEMTLVGVWVWLLLAVVPLPRFDWRGPGFGAASTSDAARPSRETPNSPAIATILPDPQVSPGAIAMTPRTGRDSRAGDPAPRENAAERIPAGREPDLENSIGITLYLWGVGLSVAFLVISAGLLLGLLLEASPAPPWLQALLRELPALHRPVRLLSSRRARRPFCLWFRHPTIVLPHALCEEDMRETLRHVLLHELVHLRQRDARGQHLFALALPLLFFHPLYWWLKHQVRWAAELLADDGAARWTTRKEYARQLIELAERYGSAASVPLGTQPFLRTRSEFFRRIEILMNRPQALHLRQSLPQRLTQLGLAAIVVASSVFFFGVGPAPAQDPTQRDERRLADLREERASLQATIRDLQEQIHLLQSLKGREAPAAQPPDEASRRQEDFQPAYVRAMPGDTLAGIVARYYGSGEYLPQLLAANPGLEPEKLPPGTKIHLPLVVTPWRESEPEEFPAGGDWPSSVSQISAGGPVISAATVDLVSRSIDLAGQLKLAEAEYNRLLPLGDSGAASDTEIHFARIQLETTRQKREVIQSIIEAELETSKAELNALQHRLGTVKASSPRLFLEAQLVRLESRLRILQRAL